MYRWMFVLDEFAYGILVVLALFFTTHTVVIPIDSGDNVSDAPEAFHLGLLPMVLRVTLFPIFSALTWGMLSIVSLTINNCSVKFGGICWTNPAFTGTTASVFVSQYAVPLALFFMIPAAVMIVYAMAVGITMFGYFMKLSKGNRNR